jgi:8-oxo-dGTP diphosphatase
MRYSHCPVCGRVIASRARDVLICGACGFHFYLNSKPCVGAVIVKKISGQDHILLTRRAIEPWKGWWDLPGGFLGNGESPEDGVKRELEEELGVEAFNLRLLSVQMGEYPRDDLAEEARFTLTVYFICDVPADAVLTPADDVSEARWFPLAGLPEEVAFEANRRAIQEASALMGAG